MVTSVSKEFKQELVRSIGSIVGKSIKIERYEKDRLRVSVCNSDGLPIVIWCDEEVGVGNNLTLNILPETFTIHLGS